MNLSSFPQFCCCDLSNRRRRNKQEDKHSKKYGRELSVQLKYIQSGVPTSRMTYLTWWSKKRRTEFVFAAWPNDAPVHNDAGWKRQEDAKNKRYWLCRASEAQKHDIVVLSNNSLKNIQLRRAGDQIAMPSCLSIYRCNDGGAAMSTIMEIR